MSFNYGFNRSNPNISRNKDRKLGAEVKEHFNKVILKYIAQDVPSPNITEWTRLALKMIEDNYNGRHNYLLRGEEWKPDKIKPKDFKFDKKTETVEAKINNDIVMKNYAQELRKISEKNAMMEKERNEIFATLLLRLSPESSREIESHKVEYDAANKYEGVDGMKSPFLLLELIMKTHTGSKSESNDVFNIRGEHAQIFNDFHKYQGEKIADFRPRLEALKTQMDSYSRATMLYIDENNENLGKHIVPIIEGDEVRYADKLIQEYKNVFPVTYKDYKKSLTDNKMKSFTTIETAYAWITKMAAANSELGHDAKRPRDDSSGKETTGNRKVLKVTKGKNQKRKERDDTDDNTPDPRLNPCGVCVKDYTEKYPGEYNDAVLRSIPHLMHWYPSQCPLAEKKPKAGDNDPEAAPVNSKPPGKAYGKSKGRSRNPFSGNKAAGERKVKFGKDVNK